MLRPCATASERAIYGEQVIVIDSKYTPGHMEGMRQQVRRARHSMHNPPCGSIRSAFSGTQFRSLFSRSSGDVRSTFPLTQRVDDDSWSSAESKQTAAIQEELNVDTT